MPKRPKYWATTCGSSVRKDLRTSSARPNAPSPRCWRPASPPGVCGASTAAGCQPRWQVTVSANTPHWLPRARSIFDRGRTGAVSRSGNAGGSPGGTGGDGGDSGSGGRRRRSGLQQAAQGEVVQPANFNSPGQMVIAGSGGCGRSGNRTAEGQGCQACDQAAGQRAFAQRFDGARGRAAWAATARNTHRNAAGAQISTRSMSASMAMPDSIRAALVQQLVKPVRWTRNNPGHGRRAVRA